MARPGAGSTVIQGNFVAGRPRFAGAIKPPGPALQTFPGPGGGAGGHVVAGVRAGRGGEAPGASRAASWGTVALLRGDPGAGPRGPAWAVPAQTLDLSRAGPGQRLPAAVQRKMEAALGASFADVRIHVGREAADLGARAFTVGRRIFFAPGEYQPRTHHGQRLLGHELTHVVQQRAGRVRNPFGGGLAVVQDPGLEAEAERMGLRAAAGQAFGGGAASPSHPLRDGSGLRPSAIAQASLGPLGGVLQLDRSPIAAPDPDPSSLADWVRYGGRVKEELEEAERLGESGLSALLAGRKSRFDWLHGTAKKWVSNGKPGRFATYQAEYTGMIQDLAGKLNEAYLRFAGTEGYAMMEEVRDESEFIGVAPSVRTPTLDISTYLNRKAQNQQLKQHVPYGMVKAAFKKTSGGPPDVKVKLQLKTGKSGLIAKVPPRLKTDSTFIGFREALSTPFSQHNHEEILNSGEDGEVDVLATALYHCHTDLHRERTERRQHLLAILGPFGPCDGCKDRIKAFKAEWRRIAREAGTSGDLTITYFYRHPSGLFRSESTLYGYNEAQRGEDPKLPGLGPISGSTAEEGEYWYRTHNTQWTDDG